MPINYAKWVGEDGPLLTSGQRFFCLAYIVAFVLVIFVMSGLIIAGVVH